MVLYFNFDGFSLQELRFLVEILDDGETDLIFEVYFPELFVVADFLFVLGQLQLLYHCKWVLPQHQIEIRWAHNLLVCRMQR